MKEGAPIIYRDVIQGTSEWAALRCGVPTASQFNRIVTPTGKPSKSAEMYRLELLAERLTGEPTVGFTSHWMDRGSDLEAEAINYYSFTTDAETEKIGFILNSARTVGASPDRLVGDSGLLEIKVPKPANHVGYLLQDSAAYSDYKIQAQGQLWVAQREWNDLLSYCPGLPFALYRAERDEPFIRMMAEEVEAFSDELERMFAVCVERGYAKDKPKSGGEGNRARGGNLGAPLPSLSDLVKQSLIEIENRKKVSV